MAYVSNAGWIDSNSADGLRKCLVEEFSSLYVFHLRGDARTSGEQRRKEKDNVFGSGSRAPIAITVLVKNTEAEKQGQIKFYDIGDYHSRDDKLRIIKEFHSVTRITTLKKWQKIIPDSNNVWLNQVDAGFDEFLVLGDKKDKISVTVFENYSNGVVTGRDAWCYNTSKSVMENDIHKMIVFYHAERKRYHQIPVHERPDVSTFIDSDPTRISWTRALKQDLVKNKALVFPEGQVLVSIYRPFSKQWMYYGRQLNEVVGQLPQIFPNAQTENRVIMYNSNWSGQGEIALMSECITRFSL